MGKFIDASGSETEIVLKNLEQIQTMIGGHFEQINVNGGLLMVCEDETFLPFNDKASELAKKSIRGNAIFATHAEVAS